MPSQLLSTCIKNISTVCNSLDFVWEQIDNLEDYLTRIAREYQATEVHFTTALVYLDRIQQQDPTLLPNLHALLTTSLVLSLKYWEDKVHSNKHYASCAGVSLKEINSWERNVLSLLDYDFSIPDAEYQVYWENLTGSHGTAFTVCSDTEIEIEDCAPIEIVVASDDFEPKCVKVSDSDVSCCHSEELIDECSDATWFPQPIKQTNYPLPLSSVSAKVAFDFNRDDVDECGEQNCLKMVGNCVLSVFSMFLLPPSGHPPNSKHLSKNRLQLKFRTVQTIHQTLCS